MAGSVSHRYLQRLLDNYVELAPLLQLCHYDGGLFCRFPLHRKQSSHDWEDFNSQV